MKVQILVAGDTIETETISNAKMISKHIESGHKINLIISESKSWGPFSGVNMWAEVGQALEIMGYAE